MANDDVEDGQHEHAQSGDDAQIDAIARMLPALLRALDALAHVTRRLHPPILHRLVREVREAEADLRQAMAEFQVVDWPEAYTRLREPIDSASAAACQAFDGLKAAVDDPEAMMLAYRALRFAPRAAEAIYPLAAHIQPISRYFLDETAKSDETLVQSLAANDAAPAQVGVMHGNNAKHERGGFSVYVPENYDAKLSYPVIVALHGGSGHGRAFLWNWLKQARSRGAILVSPTSLASTWSLMQPEIDGANIQAILSYVGEQWSLDRKRMLLTGMSDGGTFAYLCGLAKGAGFSHLAPMSASFQALMLEFADRERIAGMPIYLTHGALDWMFPVASARGARDALAAAGADVVYREIADLSHAYALEENIRILDWFLSPAEPSGPSA